MADQPHPELGGGLFCLLHAPHQLQDEHRLNQVCLQLNNMEMAAHDLPPHFWCLVPRQVGQQPGLHQLPPEPAVCGLGHRCQLGLLGDGPRTWANAMLASLGVRA
jgi:hypothetical protein